MECAETKTIPFLFPQGILFHTTSALLQLSQVRSFSHSAGYAAFSSLEALSLCLSSKLLRAFAS